MNSRNLTADLNVIANSNLEIQMLDGDLNIIQKLDDEPNDVGGLTSAQLKAKFDEGGNIIKKYINETLIPAVLADDATEAARTQAETERQTNEAARVAAENGRVTAENGRVSAETARAQAETARASAETARGNAESQRASAETTRVDNETARNQGEAARVAAENARANAETARGQAEQNRARSETARDQAETARRNSESERTDAEAERVKAEQNRVNAEKARVEAEQARADENTGIVARATAQANAAAISKDNAENSAAAAAGSAQTAQSAASTAAGAASSASTAAAAASGSASQAQASAAAAAESAASVDGINKTAQSWAVGGTGTREGEDTNNAKYWAEQAEATVGGDFATKTEAQGYVTNHNQSSTAHSDIREAIANMAETFVVTFSDPVEGSAGDGVVAVLTCTADHNPGEIREAANSGKIVIGAMIQSNGTIYFKLTGSADSYAIFASYMEGLVLYATMQGNSVNIIEFQTTSLTSNVIPSAPGDAAVGTSQLAARASHVHPKEVSDDDRTAWNSKASKPTVTTVTLSATGWGTDKKQTVTVPGVLADTSKQVIWVTQTTEAAIDAYLEAGIVPVAQAANAVTLRADTVPTAAIEVNIVVQEVQ